MSTCMVVLFEMEHLRELQQWTEWLQKGTKMNEKRAGQEETVVLRTISHHQEIGCEQEEAEI